jgi:hypothetical protein
MQVHRANMYKPEFNIFAQSASFSTLQVSSPRSTSGAPFRHHVGPQMMSPHETPGAYGHQFNAARNFSSDELMYNPYEDVGMPVPAEWFASNVVPVDPNRHVLNAPTQAFTSAYAAIPPFHANALSNAQQGVTTSFPAAPRSVPYPSPDGCVRELLVPQHRQQVIRVYETGNSIAANVKYKEEARPLRKEDNERLDRVLLNLHDAFQGEVLCNVGRQVGKRVFYKIPAMAVHDAGTEVELIVGHGERVVEAFVTFPKPTRTLQICFGEPAAADASRSSNNQVNGFDNYSSPNWKGEANKTFINELAQALETDGRPDADEIIWTITDFAKTKARNSLLANASNGGSFYKLRNEYLASRFPGQANMTKEQQSGDYKKAAEHFHYLHAWARSKLLYSPNQNAVSAAYAARARRANDAAIALFKQNLQATGYNTANRIGDTAQRFLYSQSRELNSLATGGYLNKAIVAFMDNEKENKISKEDLNTLERDLALLKSFVMNGKVPPPSSGE